MRFTRLISAIIALIATFGLATGAAAVTRFSTVDHKEISKEAAAEQYLTLVNPANLALSNFASQAQQWTNSTTDTQAEQDAAPSIAALSKVSTGLRHDRWPSQTQSGIKSLTKAIASVDGDLKSLATISSFDASTWVSAFMRNASTLKSAVAVVRHNLGLPKS